MSMPWSPASRAPRRSRRRNSTKRTSRLTNSRNDRGRPSRAAPAIVALVAGLAACATPRPHLTPATPPGSAVLDLQRDIAGLVGAPSLDHSSWGVVVRSLANDATLYALNPRR